MSGDKLRVLYVDDEPSMLDVIKDLLETEEDIQVNICTSVTEAKSLLGRMRHDAVISDYDMPSANGLAFLKALRAEGNNIPFILFTGRGREEVAIDALNNGADYYLQKGSDVHVITVELLHRIHSLVEKRRAQDAIAESERTAWVLINVRQAPALLLDKDLTILAINDFMADMTGLPHGGLVGRKASEVMPPGMYDKTKGHIEQVLRTGQTMSFIINLFGKQFQATLSPIKQGNEVTRVALQSHDITDILKAEDGLRRRLAIEELLSNITSGMLLAKAEDMEEAMISALREIGLFMNVERCYIEFMTAREDAIHGIMLDVATCEVSYGGTEDLSKVRFPWIYGQISSGERVLMPSLDLLPKEAIADRDVLEGMGVGAMSAISLNGESGMIGSLWFLCSHSCPERSDEDESVLSMVADLMTALLRRMRTEWALQARLDELQESQRAMTAFLGELPGIAYRCHNDKERRMTFISSNCHVLTRYEADDFLRGRINYADIISSEDRDAVWTEIQRCIDERTPYRLEYRIRTKKGDLKWVWEQGRPVPQPDTGKVMLEGLIMDISDLKLTQHSLQERENKLTSIFRAAPVAIGVTNNRILMDVNDTMCDMLGYGRDELIGQSARMLYVDQEDFEWVGREKYKLVAEKGTGVVETRWKKKNGEVIGILLSTTPLDMRDPSKGYTFSALDITERKKAQEAFRLSNRKLSLLSSVTRHDINNQLSVVNGRLELLRRMDPSPIMLKHLEQMEHALYRIQTSIRFTGDYEKLGLSEPKWQSVGLLVEEVVRQFNLKGVQVVQELGTLEVFADPMLSRVLYNLIENSLLHGDGVTRISISDEELGDHFVIIYEDNGVGIADNDRPHMFERGFGKNTGFGLFLSREILELTSIKIDEMGRSGEGVRFVISVPSGNYRFR